MRARSFVVMFAAVLFAASSSATAQSKAPQFGTWKLNVAKSKYSPGPAPKSQVTKNEAWEDGMKATSDQVDAQGKSIHTEIMARFDGKEYPLKGAEPPTTRAYTRIDGRSYQFVTRIEGKVTTTTKVLIAADGKTRTITVTGKDVQGRIVNNVTIWDRQDGAAQSAQSKSQSSGTGTWKANVAKSKYSPGAPPKSQTAKYEPWESGFKRTIDTVDAQGQTTHTEVIFKYDGKDYPVVGAAQPQTTVAFKRIDNRTTENVQKINGKVTVTTRRAISGDGKTATVTQTGKNAQGQTVKNTIVQDRQ